MRTERDPFSKSEPSSNENREELGGKNIRTIALTVHRTLWTTFSLNVHNFGNFAKPAISFGRKDIYFEKMMRNKKSIF